eukprot:CAMPEP_0114540284 /NCGR_PEP_ID=MMETSP0114-20121206/680_1 /TAXON_ID=31324 /ORGANISM="Goniomonas sp, Strain m" /LENGTH=286 /DNA_ID=CAMNT_0001724425 /DNA_START=45 /DNA_END=906 /DNA_ORIENTATION=-
MIISFFLLHHRYDCYWKHDHCSWGVHCCDPNSDPPSGSHVLWYSCLIFWAANVPNALSSVCKEYALKGTCVLDVMYLTMWVGLFQTGFGFAFIPLQALPGFGGFPLAGLGSNLWDGILCTIGHNPFLDDDCAGYQPAIFLSGYVVINFAYNVLGLFLTKHGSATLASIAYTLQIPFTNVLFSICSIMGSDCEPFTVWSGTGLGLVLGGFCVHAYFEHRNEQRTKVVLRERRSLLGINSEDDPDAGVGWYHSKLPDFTIGRKADPLDIIDTRARAYNDGTLDLASTV